LAVVDAYLYTAGIALKKNDADESSMTTSADILAHRAKQLAPCNCIVTSLKRDQKEQKGGHI